MSTPRMEIVWRVLERALDNEDWDVVEACRRLVVANRMGWRRFTSATDWNTVMAFDDHESIPPTNDLVDSLDDSGDTNNAY